MKIFFASYFLYFLYRFFQLTWKIEIRESAALKELVKENKTFVVAHWHGEELGILHLLKRYRVACMVSQSFDGELVARMIHHFGSKAVRGSSSRGAVQALKGILRLAKEGWRPSVAVDGPRGPRHEVKLGVVEIARVLKVPILPINMACSRSFIFKKSWNKSELPLPFSRIVIQWGEPIEYDPAQTLESYLPPLARALHAGRAECMKSVGKPTRLN
jgi:lysophospholipid acyltransferase (LPLAT)-like uncharacterized protein